MKKIIIAIFVILITTSGGSPEKAIKGIVIDKETKEELVGVKIEAGKETTYTDMEGKFKIKGKDAMIKVTLISYQPILIKSEEAEEIRLNKVK